MKVNPKTKNVLVGVCGGISAYKTCVLVRLLVKNSYAVKVVMTEAATKFVTALTFQNLSQNPVYTRMFEPLEPESVRHISLAQWADVCLLAPASANTIGKIASGICDNLLTTVISALPKQTKVILAPAMNECMWQNPLIQQNVSKLKKLKKYVFLKPKAGELACGTWGEGRMLEAADIFKSLKAAL